MTAADLTPIKAMLLAALPTSEFHDSLPCAWLSYRYVDFDKLAATVADYYKPKIAMVRAHKGIQSDKQLLVQEKTLSKFGKEFYRIAQERLSPDVFESIRVEAKLASTVPTAPPEPLYTAEQAVVTLMVGDPTLWPKEEPYPNGDSYPEDNDIVLFGIPVPLRADRDAANRAYWKAVGDSSAPDSPGEALGEPLVITTEFDPSLPRIADKDWPVADLPAEFYDFEEDEDAQPPETLQEQLARLVEAVRGANCAADAQPPTLSDRGGDHD